MEEKIIFLSEDYKIEGLLINNPKIMVL